MKIPKKGDLTDCNNGRPLSRTKITRRNIAQILFERMTTKINKRIKNNRVTFRTQNNIRRNEYDVEGNLTLFVDFEKAFYYISRKKIWKILAIMEFWTNT